MRLLKKITHIIFILIIFCIFVPLAVVKADVFHCCQPCQQADTKDAAVDPAAFCTKCGGAPEPGECPAASAAAGGGSVASGCKIVGKQTVCELSNPLGKGITGVPQIVGNIIKAALGIIGALTLLMFVWGGFMWLTSAGNQERIKKGSQTMLWAAIGVVLVFASYLILSTFTTLLETGKVPGA